MEKTVDRIESMFTQAEADLDLMQKKLELQFSGDNGEKQQQNPVELMKKLKSVKDEYAQISQQAALIQEEQREFSDFFRSQLKTLIEMVKALESNTGQMPEEDPAIVGACHQISTLLGIPEGELQPFLEAPLAHEDTAKGGKLNGDVCASSNNVSAKDTQKTDCIKDEKTYEPPNLADLRISGDDFIEVSKEEFLSVSELIRQKVKLEDVNKVYRSLWQFFKEDKNTGVLTPKDMNTMGLRVTGATGQAKLKVLRALKICQINRTGDVKLA